MSDKIVVPGGMLDAALEVARERRGYPHLASLGTARLKANVQAELEAALRWIAKNPIGPTNEQAKELWRTSTAGETNEARRASLAAVEWQRRMFLAPEPEVPEEIKDLLFVGGILTADQVLNEYPKGEVDKLILEAYRRGQKSTREIYRFRFTGFKPVDHPILAEWLADAKDKGVDQATQVNYRRLFERAFEAGRKFERAFEAGMKARSE